MKLATSVQMFTAPQIQAVQTSAPNENLDAGQKIFYDVLNSLSAEDKGLGLIFDKAVVTGFTGNAMTLAFKSDVMANMFKKTQQQFEQTLAQVAGRAIKVSVVIDTNLPSPILKNMSEPDRSNLAGAMEVFHASDAAKIND